MSENAPLIRLEEGGSAPILRYDIPEPTSYEGKNFIELDFEGDVYAPAALEMPTQAAGSELKNLPDETIREEVRKFLKTGMSRSTVAATTSIVTNASPTVIARLPDGDDPLPNEDNPVPEDDDRISVIVDQIKSGGVLVKGTTMHGDPTVGTVPVPLVPDPHLYLVESIRLSSFLGDYGAGRIVKTFTLLPGEVTKISVKTFRQTESTRRESSSVLDSFTSESATDLEKSIQTEQSDQKSYSKNFSYYADVEASASWGWGSAKAKAGVKGDTNSTREEAVKNVSNATQKHASKASAKREVEINTGFEVTEKVGEERSIEREIENVNLSRTLNFVFRQMNQEFISFLHLVDVRVGFFNGDPGSRQEVPVSALDSLLDKFITPADQDAVRDAILDQLRGIRDRDGNVVDVLSTVEIAPGDVYRRFDPDLLGSFTDARGRNYEVPGVLLSADVHVMRTEGVIVEALLGNGEALDGYAERLQELEVQRREAEVATVVANAEQAQLINEAIRSGDQSRASIAEKFVCPCGCPDHQKTSPEPRGTVSTTPSSPQPE